MLSGRNVFVLGLILGFTATPQYTFAKNGVKPSSTPAASKEVENEVANEQEVEPETETAASKAAKEADKLAKKAAQDAAKAAKVQQKASSPSSSGSSTSPSTAQSRIELLAKMKQAEIAGQAVDASENEASLKYRVKNSVHKLTAEIEGFNDGDIFSMYVVIGAQEILVSKMELVMNGTIPAQEIEFDDATWPTNLPLVLSAGMVVRVRDSQGAVVLEGALASK